MPKASKKPAKKAVKAAAKPAPKATKKVSPIPAGFHTLTPHIVVKGADKAIEFYKKAFGAQDGPCCVRDPKTGSVCHAEIKIGDSVLMMCEENLEWGAKSPFTVGGNSGSIHMYVNDVDAVFKKAVEAGAKGEQEPTNMFWGDRHGTVVDPFGHKWGISTRVEDLTPEQIEVRAKKWWAEQEKARQEQPVAANN